MDSPKRRGSREENLNDSWVELHFQQQQLLAQSSAAAASEASVRLPGGPPGLGSGLPGGLPAGMEKLLLDAARESRGSSRLSSQPGSSRASPKSPHSPNNELAPASPFIGEIHTIQEGQVLAAVQQAELPALQPVPTDWIWDWSSRPEALPPSDHRRQFRHPSKQPKLSVRNSKVLKGPLFSLENLPALLVTHACTFFLGAAAMFIYLKKYCNWSSGTVVTLSTIATE